MLLDCSERNEVQQRADGGIDTVVEIASFLADLGRLAAEDRPVGGSGASGDVPVDAATQLYAKRIAALAAG